MLKKTFTIFRQRYMDLEISISAHVKARIVERPGLWLPGEKVSSLLDDLRTIARKSVPHGTLDYGILKGDARPLEQSVLTVLYEKHSGKPIAFNALVVLPVEIHGKPARVTHLGLVMIDPEARSKGFSWALYGLTCLLFFARGQLRPIWLSNVTQVPAIVGMVSESFSNVYPRPGAGARATFEHLLIARQIMQAHRDAFGVGDDANFDENRFVIENAYTGGSDNLKKSFDEAQKHRDDGFNAFCAEQLDYDRGDDFLQLGQLDLSAAKSFIMKDVPRRSLPAVAAAAAFLTLQRLLLPILYWYSPERAWGILRPALPLFRRSSP